VLFADVTHVNELKMQMGVPEMNEFFRNLADQFKLALRPTDTMAWSPQDEHFLTLIEEIPNPEAPLKIAGRVKESMKKFLETNDSGLGLRANVGVLLCDYAYENVEQIMDDVNTARKYLREELYTNPSIFDRDMLKRE
jgi:GGDEF domain-containing protein